MTKKEDGGLEFIMITGTGCPSCATAKKKLKKQIEAGTVRILDVTKDDEAIKLVKKHDITGVPSIVVKNKGSSYSKLCKLSEDYTKALCGESIIKI